MKVKEVIPFKSEIVVIDDGESYMRNSSDDWDMLYGNSSEGLSYSDCEKLEIVYQEWKNKNKPF